MGSEQRAHREYLGILAAKSTKDAKRNGKKEISEFENSGDRPSDLKVER